MENFNIGDTIIFYYINKTYRGFITSRHEPLIDAWKTPHYFKTNFLNRIHPGIKAINPKNLSPCRVVLIEKI